MNRKQGRLFLSFNAIEDFLASHADDIPKTIRTGTRERFAQALSRVKDYVRAQAGAPLSAQSLTAVKEDKQQVLLRDHMAPIVRIARSDGSGTARLDALKMPRGELGVPKLIARASGMLDVAREHQRLFIDAGMPADFVDRFQRAIEDVADTVDARAREHGAGRGATVGLEVALRECKRLRNVLDTFINSELVDQPALLANWRSVKRVHRLASRPAPELAGAAERPVEIPMMLEPAAQPAVLPNGSSVSLLPTAIELPVRDPARLIAASLDLQMIVAARDEQIQHGHQEHADEQT